jgi:hypothetical protein
MVFFSFFPGVAVSVGGAFDRVSTTGAKRRFRPRFRPSSFPPPSLLSLSLDTLPSPARPNLIEI